MVFTDESLRAIRRDLHAHPEEGWCEYRTSALVAATLDDLGYTIKTGEDALAVKKRMGVPNEGRLRAAFERANESDAPSAYLDEFEETTGLVATQQFGDGDGPVVGVRVDMDALPLSEARDGDHRPAAEGFASRHPDEMHACGHDGHIAIGLGAARELARNGGFTGTLRLFVQPAEEGLRGGRAMSQTALLDEVDYLLGFHLGLDRATGTVVAGLDGSYPSSKVDVTFEGEAAHAGAEPHKGRNALQALSAAVTNLYALPRHGDGITRINVGHVSVPNAQNVIADEAQMRYELRSDKEPIRQCLADRATDIIRGAAEMHDIKVDETTYGSAPTFEASEELVETVVDVTRSEGVDTVVPSARLSASEDVAHLINRVQETGGQATYLGIGSSNVAGHHDPQFDFDEEALEIGKTVLVETIRELT
jgi:aminobenzoyl-glutamate utilization protein A